jgi:hypothetical protein
MVGVYGSTAEVELVNDHTSLDPGSTEVFNIKAADVNRLRSATLRIVRAGTSAGAVPVLTNVAVFYVSRR